MQKRHHDPTPKNKKAFTENDESLILKWSGRQDLNLRPLVPQTSALPDCATPRTKQAGSTTLGFYCQGIISLPFIFFCGGLWLSAVE